MLTDGWKDIRKKESVRETERERERGRGRKRQKERYLERFRKLEKYIYI